MIVGEEDARRYFMEEYHACGDHIAATCKVFGIDFTAGAAIVDGEEIRPVTVRRVLAVIANRMNAGRMAEMRGILDRNMQYKGRRW